MDQQPTRSGTYREPREFDKTSLKTTDTFRITRDIIAHAFRYGFARRFINNTTTVLDVGCGNDLPLLKTLAQGYANAIPKEYVGIDLNNLAKPTTSPWAMLKPKFNFVERYQELPKYDIVVALECLEHVLEKHQETFMRGLKHCLKEDGLLILSTPVFNGKTAARNHLRELTIAELQTLIDKVKLFTQKRFGTFASYHELKRVITPEQLATLDALNEYYYHDLSACFLAPIYPDQSRNNCWLIRHAKPIEETLGTDYLLDPEGC